MNDSRSVVHVFHIIDCWWINSSVVSRSTNPKLLIPTVFSLFWWIIFKFACNPAILEIVSSLSLSTLPTSTKLFLLGRCHCSMMGIPFVILRSVGYIWCCYALSTFGTVEVYPFLVDLVLQLGCHFFSHSIFYLMVRCIIKQLVLFWLIVAGMPGSWVTQTFSWKIQLLTPTRFMMYSSASGIFRLPLKRHQKPLMQIKCKPTTTQEILNVALWGEVFRVRCTRLVRPFKVLGGERNQCDLTQNSLSTGDPLTTCGDEMPIQCFFHSLWMRLPSAWVLWTGGQQPRRSRILPAIDLPAFNYSLLCTGAREKAFLGFFSVDNLRHWNFRGKTCYGRDTYVAILWSFLTFFFHLLRLS